MHRNPNSSAKAPSLSPVDSIANLPLTPLLQCSFKPPLPLCLAYCNSLLPLPTPVFTQSTRCTVVPLLQTIPGLPLHSEYNPGSSPSGPAICLLLTAHLHPQCPVPMLVTQAFSLSLCVHHHSPPHPAGLPPILFPLPGRPSPH